MLETKLRHVKTVSSIAPEPLSERHFKEILKKGIWGGIFE